MEHIADPNGVQTFSEQNGLIMNAAPLSGIKVVELARILAGPWIGQTLSDLGCEVIKVESPNGDDTRGATLDRDRR